MSIELTHLILMSKGPEADEFTRAEDQKLPNRFGNLFTKVECSLINIYFFIQDGLFQYYVLYFGISLLGFFSHEIFYSFHLLDVLMRFPELKNVVNSVTSNGTQLAMTALLALIIIYIYTTVSFFYLQDTLYDYNINPYDSDIVGENRCVSMIQCYMTVLDRGLVLGGGIGDYTE